MNERERILDLVKKGVLSTEEALDLLESIANEKDASQIQRAEEEVKARKADKVDDTINQEKTMADLEREDKEHLESILEKLTAKATHASAELDEISVELEGISQEQAEIADEIMQLNTKEELGELTDSEREQRQTLEEQLKELAGAAEELKAEQQAIDEEMKTIRKEQWKHTKEKVSQKFDIPDDWKEQANETFSQVSDKMLKSGSKFGKSLLKTIQSVTDTIGENVEWKNIHVKVPGVAATKFDKSYEFPATEATIIDMKVANGKIQLKKHDEEVVRMEAAIKLYGKVADEDPEEVFASRSQIIVDEEKISVQIPNKRIRAELIVYLPAKIYDHVSIKMLNGAILIDDLVAKDVYLKSTNGDLMIQSLSATMLEMEGVNGEISIQSGVIRDTVIESVNGSITFTTTPETASISLVNGDIKCTFTESTLKKLEATSVNGNIKLAVPATLGMNGLAKTSMGSIQSRMTNYDIIREKKDRMNQLLDFARVAEDMATITVGTTTGTIYLKDSQSL